MEEDRYFRTFSERSFQWNCYCEVEAIERRIGLHCYCMNMDNRCSYSIVSSTTKKYCKAAKKRDLTQNIRSVRNERQTTFPIDMKTLLRSAHCSPDFVVKNKNLFACFVKTEGSPTIFWWCGSSGEKARSLKHGYTKTFFFLEKQTGFVTISKRWRMILGIFRTIWAVTELYSCFKIFC